MYFLLPWKYKDTAKKVTGSRWHKEYGEWSFPPSAFPELLNCLPHLHEELEADIRTIYAAQAASVINKAKDQELPEKFNLDADIADVVIPDIDLKVRLDDGTYGEPFEHQLKAVKCGIKYNQFAFFMEMATGKTKSVIDVIRCRMALGQKIRPLIVCPKSVIYNWGNELDKNGFPNYNIINGSKKKRVNSLADALLREVPAVMGYDSLIYTGEQPFWKMFNCIILDESTYIKTHDAKRTRFVLQYFKDTTLKYILSGTPITNAPIDIFSQFAFLNKKFLGHSSYYAFRNQYCVMQKQGTGFKTYQVIIGYKNKPQLMGKIARHSLQMKKEDCLDLPEKIYTVRHMDMPPEMKRQYREMETTLALELENGDTVTAQIILTKMLRLQQILAGEYVEKKDNAKLQTLGEIVNETLENDRQIVLFARFKHSIRLITDYIENDLKHKIEVIDGAKTDEERRDSLESFQSGRVKIFLGQLQATSFGINLFKGSTAVYYENTFSFENRKQSEDRIHRPGQKNICTYIDLIYKDSIDEHVFGALARKQDMASSLVDSFPER